MHSSPSISNVIPARYPISSPEPSLPFQFDEEGMPIPIDGLRVSEEIYWEYFAYHPEYSIELNDGLLEVKEMSEHDTHLVALWFKSLIMEYMISHPEVQMTEAELIVEIELPEKKTKRKPDIGVVSSKNPHRIPGRGGVYRGVYDICGEVLSDSEKQAEERDTVDKVREYAIAGTREYYILHWSKEKCVFYHLERGRYVRVEPEDGIFRSSVLPGFQFRLADLFGQPLLEKMAEDEVYKSFVGLALQNKTARAEALEKEKEKETARAEALEKEKEKETARAKALEKEKEKETARAAALEKEKEKETVRAETLEKEKEKETVRAETLEKEKEKETARAKSLEKEKEKETARAEAAEEKALQEKRRADDSDEKNRKIQEWLKKQGIDPGKISS